MEHPEKVFRDELGQFRIDLLLMQDVMELGERLEWQEFVESQAELEDIDSGDVEILRMMTEVVYDKYTVPVESDDYFERLDSLSDMMTKNPDVSKEDIDFVVWVTEMCVIRGWILKRDVERLRQLESKVFS